MVLADWGGGRTVNMSRSRDEDPATQPRLTDGFQDSMGPEDVHRERTGSVVPGLGDVREAGQMKDAGGLGVTDRGVNLGPIEYVYWTPLGEVTDFGRRCGTCPGDDPIPRSKMFDEVTSGKTGSPGDEDRRLHLRCSYWAW